MRLKSPRIKRVASLFAAVALVAAMLTGLAQPSLAAEPVEITYGYHPYWTGGWTGVVIKPFYKIIRALKGPGVDAAAKVVDVVHCISTIITRESLYVGHPLQGVAANAMEQDQRRSVSRSAYANKSLAI